MQSFTVWGTKFILFKYEHVQLILKHFFYYERFSFFGVICEVVPNLTKALLGITLNHGIFPLCTVNEYFHFISLIGIFALLYIHKLLVTICN